MKLTANAKINLMLDVEGKRTDGYHNVKMIMQSLEFGDIVEIEKSNKITLSGSNSNLPYDGSNLAYKSAKLFFENTGIDSGADIYIEKNIPVCAGLAGGSSDAATVFIGLNKLYDNPLKQNELLKLSAKLGADIPFCITKGTAIASGIGDIITPIPAIPKKTILIVKPSIDVSTPWAYKNLNLLNIHHPNVDSAVSYIESKNMNSLYSIMENVFETVIFKTYPTVENIKKQMIDFGANAALMSGSGPTVFGIFENEFFAKSAYNKFKIKYNETFLTKSFNV